LQLNFASNLYKIPKIEIDLKLNAVVTNYGQDSSLSKKEDIIGSFRRNMPKNYFGAAHWDGSKY
jgi:hypothetical protein